MASSRHARKLPADVTDSQIDDAFRRASSPAYPCDVSDPQNISRQRVRALLSNTNPVMWNDIIAKEFRKEGREARRLLRRHCHLFHRQSPRNRRPRYSNIPAALSEPDPKKRCSSTIRQPTPAPPPPRIRHSHRRAGYRIHRLPSGRVMQHNGAVYMATVRNVRTGLHTGHLSCSASLAPCRRQSGCAPWRSHSPGIPPRHLPLATRAAPAHVGRSQAKAATPVWLDRKPELIDFSPEFAAMPGARFLEMLKAKGVLTRHGFKSLSAATA